MNIGSNPVSSKRKELEELPLQQSCPHIRSNDLGGSTVDINESSRDGIKLLNISNPETIRAAHSLIF